MSGSAETTVSIHFISLGSAASARVRKAAQVLLVSLMEVKEGIGT